MHRRTVLALIVLFQIVILIALWGLRVLWEKSSSGAIRSILAVVLGLSVLAYPTRLAVERGKEFFEYPPPSEIEAWVALFPPDALFLSDTPDYLAARLDRPSLFLPTFPSLERSLERWDAPVVLHLSPAYREFLESERESPAKWEDWIESHSQSPDFPIDPRFGNHRFVRIR